jgi:hypothetical protein
MSDENPIAAIVHQLGGQVSTARMLNLGQSTIAGWVAARRVPSQRILELIETARRLEPPVLLQPNDFFAVALAPVTPAPAEAAA